jgi:Ca2+-binding RTX toxin-like protein
MTNLLQTTLNKTYNQLKNFAGLNDFWNLFEIAFGTQYDHTVATNLRSQWLVGDFSSFPQIEVLDSSILGNASGAYGTSTNKIYLAANFLDTATDTDIIAVLLEEYGHFVDAHINQTDSAGDEGDIFSNLVRGNILSAETLQALKGENDHATITLDGHSIEIEQGVIQLTDLTIGSPALLTWADNLNRYQYENVRTIGGGYRARFKNTFLPGPILNPFPNPIPAGIPPLSTVATTINELTSTEKGLLIHTAGPNHVFGSASPWTPWSLATGFSNIPNATNFIQTIALSATGNTRHIFAEDTYNSTVGTPINVGILRYTGVGGVKVTLDWTGPASNNLDVYLTNTLGGSPLYTPSFIGTETTVTNDNIEQIFSTTIPAGNYYIYVTKNSTVTTPFIQDFSIFATANNPVTQGHGWGDVHLVNFDGKPYDFQAVGEFILVKSLIDDFQVQTRQKPWGASTTVSVNTAFATTIDGYNVVFDTKLPVGQQLKIDGSTYNLLNGQSVFLGNSKIERTQANDPYGGFVDAYILTYAGPDGIIATSDDDKVTAYDHTGSYINIFVDPADYRFGVLQGLLGNGDGVSTNDFALRDGTDLGPNPTDQTIHTTYADSWRITQQESLFGTPTFADKSFPANYVSLQTLAQQNPQGVANAFAKGREFGIAEGAFLNGGVFDFVVTGDEGFLKGAKLAANLALKNGDIQIPLGSIQGSKWNDANANGIWDEGEKALAGWTIYIDSVTNGKLDPWEISTVTNADGQYTFSNLGPGEYAILEVNQTGWIQTFPTTPYALNLKAGEKLTGINFGNYFQLPTINLSPNSQTIVEGLTTPQNASYTVTLSQASNQTVSVNYATANGTATAASDYTATIGTLTFAPGVTTQVINIPILNDSLNEADETFTLTLSSPTNATLGTTTTVTTAITDTLTAGVTTVLPANVENLTLTGAAAINGTGNAGNNVITGNTGNNILNGGAGVDTLIGGLGNDTYIVDTATDTITELAGGGTDTIQSSVTYTIAALNNVENLTLTGTAAINGTGNAGNNVITGNTANNLLNGGGGNDTLNGGLGVDSLTGGVGNDFFWLDNVANRDLITDFSVPDTIILANSLDSTLTGPINPGIKGLSFVGGNVPGNVLNAARFFKGAGITGGALGNLSGIYVNTSNGDIWYNDSNLVGSYLIANVGATAAAGMTNADFVYGV